MMRQLTYKGRRDWAPVKGSISRRTMRSIRPASSARLPDTSRSGSGVSAWNSSSASIRAEARAAAALSAWREETAAALSEMSEGQRRLEKDLAAAVREAGRRAGEAGAAAARGLKDLGRALERTRGAVRQAAIRLGRGQDLRGSGQVAHQRRAGRDPADLLRRTPHVDVDDLCTVRHIDPRRFRQCLRIGADDLHVAMVLSLVGGAATLWFLLRAITTSFRLRKARLGLYGKMAAGQEIDQLMRAGARVFHDLPGDGFNIDHVIVARQGAVSLRELGVL